MSDSSNTLHRVLTALAVLGEATPKAIATHAGLGYSTVTPKLRALDAHELAMSGPDASGKTVWKLTPKGVLAAAVTSDTLLDEATAPQPTEGATSQPADPAESPAEEPAAEQTLTIDPIPSDESAADAEPDDEDGHKKSEPVAPVMHDADGQPPTAPIDDEPDAGPAGTDRPQPDQAPQTPPADNEPTTATDLPIGPSSPDGGADDDPLVTSADGGGPVVDPKDADPAPDAEASAEPRDGDAAPEKQPRRRGGSLKNAALKVLQDNPDEQFRVGQVCKAINATNTDPSAAKASAGAVSNALVGWLNDGVIKRTVEKPATYQAI